MQNIEMQDCIEACNACRDECEKTLFSHCLDMGGEHVEKKHVRLMTDCIEICQTAAHFMLRGSDLHDAACAACAEVCEACAESCEELKSDEMKDCAEICHHCAESCRKMSGTMQGMRASEESSRSAGKVM